MAELTSRWCLCVWIATVGRPKERNENDDSFCCRVLAVRFCFCCGALLIAGYSLGWLTGCEYVAQKRDDFLACPYRRHFAR